MKPRKEQTTTSVVLQKLVKKKKTKKTAQIHLPPLQNATPFHFFTSFFRFHNHFLLPFQLTNNGSHTHNTMEEVTLHLVVVEPPPRLLWRPSVPTILYITIVIVRALLQFKTTDRHTSICFLHLNNVKEC